MELRGRVALVTGGARRMGRAFAEALAGEGMRLAIHYGSSRDEAIDTRDAIQTAGGDAEIFAADLRDATAAGALPGAVVAQFGQLDLLVNSAAVMEKLGVAETSIEQWDAILHLNLRAPFFLAQQAAPYLRKTHGKIINIADLAGLDPWPNYAAHSISKAGVVMLTRVLAAALAPEITVNAIAPGAVLVPDDFDRKQKEFLVSTTPLKRLGTPDDAVQALLYLVKHADFATGDVLVVDGGRTLRR